MFICRTTGRSPRPEGLKEIRTELLQVPSNDNGQVAIVQATVTTEKGVFQGLGDASPQNVARAMLTCLIRLAETRAKARALRDAVNVGAACLDELDTAGAPDEVQQVSTVQPAATPAPTNRRPPAPPAPAVAPVGRTVPHIVPEHSPEVAEAMTPAQRGMLEALARQTGQQLNLEGMTRREATRLITELKGQRAATA